MLRIVAYERDEPVFEYDGENASVTNDLPMLEKILASLEATVDYAQTVTEGCRSSRESG
jgi:hypothetical protein